MSELNEQKWLEDFESQFSKRVVVQPPTLFKDFTEYDHIKKFIQKALDQRTKEIVEIIDEDIKLQRDAWDTRMSEEGHTALLLRSKALETVKQYILSRYKIN